jgi:RNA polymerase-binding transcription factor DksA
MDRPESPPQTPRHGGGAPGPGPGLDADADPGAVAEALQAERHQALSLLADLTRGHRDIVAAAVDSNLDDEHDPEGATIAFERAQVEALIVQARHRLAEVDAALARLDSGSYGRCLACGEAIAPARLEARPTARTCITCASVSRTSSRGPSAPG